jgi:5-methylcytosine-specific restriction endonuclease McrA
MVFQKGNKSNSGRKFTPEHRAKISAANKGKPKTPEHIAKISGVNSYRWKPEKHNRKCQKCGVPVWRGSDFCMACGTARGAKRWNWKGGITPLTQSIRASFKSRQWRCDVFERDKYTCTLCGGKGELNADHYPKSFAQIFQENKITSLEQALACEEFWNINNGRTLCKECHRKTKTYGSKKSYLPFK